MSDNQDLKSKILSMRQKNFGEAIEKSIGLAFFVSVSEAIFFSPKPSYAK